MEYVDNEVHIIQQNPSSAPQSFQVLGANALLLKFVEDVLGDGLDLYVRRSACDDEVIGRSRDTPQVENNDVMGLTLQRQLGGSPNFHRKLRRIGHQHVHSRQISSPSTPRSP